MVATVLGVFVGEPRIIGEVGGKPVDSGIGKLPVPGAEVELGLTNLAGDRQADLTVHGGRDKAVYVYPSEHYAAWAADGFDLAARRVGENVSLAGILENEARLGDLWRWGDALVEVSQPRAPCFKFALHSGRKDVGPRMIATRRSGWYLRVVEPGTVPTQGTMNLLERTPTAASIREAFGAVFTNGEDDDVLAASVERVLASPGLSDAWREFLEARVDRR